MDNRNINNTNHSMVLENRKNLSVSGVKDVISFDEQNIIAETVIGEMIINGSDLKINRFCTETADLAVEGEINAISYSDNVKADGGFFSRIFR